MFGFDVRLRYRPIACVLFGDYLAHPLDLVQG